jgi:UDP-4-amino-4-deoxy-L-arabinose-oxoglutarate aminotransferase
MVELGYKANLTDLDAALLRPQLAQVEEKRARREKIATRYERLLRERVADLGLGAPTMRDVPWLIEPRGRSSHHLFTIHTWPQERDLMLSKLGEAGIGTAVNYRAIHRLAHLVERLGIARGALPVAEEIGDRTISLPMYPTLTQEEQDRVVDAVASAWKSYF